MIGQEIVERLSNRRVLAIVRADDTELAGEMMVSLSRAGIGIAEVSLSSRRGIEALASAVAAYGDDLVIGAGTVRSVADARAAVDAGARFLVSPGLDLEVHGAAARLGVLHIPGVMTPTEVDIALNAGIEVLKLFPAGRLGPAYVADLLAPFPRARFVATGGVSVDDAPAFLNAGAIAVALGAALFPPEDPAKATAIAARVQLIANTHPKEPRAD